MNLRSANYIYLRQNFQIHYNFCTFPPSPLVIGHVINVKIILAFIKMLFVSAAAENSPSIFLSPPTRLGKGAWGFQNWRGIGIEVLNNQYNAVIPWCSGGPSMGQVLDKFQGIISVKIWIFRLFVSRVTGGKEKKEHTTKTLFVFYLFAWFPSKCGGRGVIFLPSGYS